MVCNIPTLLLREQEKVKKSSVQKVMTGNVVSKVARPKKSKVATRGCQKGGLGKREAFHGGSPSRSTPSVWPDSQSIGIDSAI